MKKEDKAFRVSKEKSSPTRSKLFSLPLFRGRSPYSLPLFFSLIVALFSISSCQKPFDLSLLGRAAQQTPCLFGVTDHTWHYPVPDDIYNREADLKDSSGNSVYGTTTLGGIFPNGIKRVQTLNRMMKEERFAAGGKPGELYTSQLNNALGKDFVMDQEKGIPAGGRADGGLARFDLEEIGEDVPNFLFHRNHFFSELDGVMFIFNPGQVNDSGFFPAFFDGIDLVTKLFTKGFDTTKGALFTYPRVDGATDIDVFDEDPVLYFFLAAKCLLRGGTLEEDGTLCRYLSKNFLEFLNGFGSTNDDVIITTAARLLATDPKRSYSVQEVFARAIAEQLIMFTIHYGMGDKQLVRNEHGQLKGLGGRDGIMCFIPQKLLKPFIGDEPDDADTSGQLSWVLVKIVQCPVIREFCVNDPRVDFSPF